MSVGFTARALTEVARGDGGAAAEKGIRPGDVIVEVGQEPVASPAEVETKIADAQSAKRKSVLFLIQSEGDLRFIPMPVPE